MKTQDQETADASANAIPDSDPRPDIKDSDLGRVDAPEPVSFEEHATLQNLDSAGGTLLKTLEALDPNNLRPQGLTSKVLFYFSSLQDVRTLEYLSALQRLDDDLIGAQTLLVRLEEATKNCDSYVEKLVESIEDVDAKMRSAIFRINENTKKTKTEINPMKKMLIARKLQSLEFSLKNLQNVRQMLVAAIGQAEYVIPTLKLTTHRYRSALYTFLPAWRLRIGADNIQSLISREKRTEYSDMIGAVRTAVSQSDRRIYPES